MRRAWPPPMREVGFNSAISLLSTYAGQGPDLKPWLADAEINRMATCACNTWPAWL